MEPAAQAFEIGKRFGSTQALDGVSVAVQLGEIRGLVGRNGAGKSTLVGVLTGMIAPDTGHVAMQGAASCVYQHSKIVSTLSVAENVFLNRQPRRGALVDWPRMRAETAALFERWGIAIDPAAPASSLSVEQRQLVEIVRALSFGARFVILDEPTARLDVQQNRRLFSALRTLRDAGAAILFISHHLDEVFELCDTVTVLRDGAVVAGGTTAELSKNEIVAAMAGPQSQDIAERATRALGDERLRVDAIRGQGFHDVTLSVKAGEIVGICGTGASGKISAAEAIAGLRTYSGGAVHASGGIGVVPRDRHREGLVLGLSVAENATMTIASQLGRLGFISTVRRERCARESIDRLGIVARPNQAASELSGGNQQKVVLARALASKPGVLILIDPTAGVDVHSKAQLHACIVQAAQSGSAVLLVSDDLDELRLCDRVLVMLRGRISYEAPAGWADRRLIGAMEGVDCA